MTKSKVGKASYTYLKNELNRAYQLIAILRTQLMKEDIDSFNKPPDWTKPLSSQEIVLMTLLLKNYPRCVTKEYLEENLPRQDHAKECKSRRIEVVVSKTRKIIGYETIETISTFGYRCSDEFANKYKHTIK